eukprot:9265674-Pyramimonas_sp.AAC.1
MFSTTLSIRATSACTARTSRITGCRCCWNLLSISVAMPSMVSGGADAVDPEAAAAGAVA